MEGTGGVDSVRVTGGDCGLDIHGFVSGFANFLFLIFFVVCDRVSDTKYNDLICITGRSL